MAKSELQSLTRRQPSFVGRTTSFAAATGYFFFLTKGLTRRALWVWLLESGLSITRLKTYEFLNQQRKKVKKRCSKNHAWFKVKTPTLGGKSCYFSSKKDYPFFAWNLFSFPRCQNWTQIRVHLQTKPLCICLLSLNVKLQRFNKNNNV